MLRALQLAKYLEHLHGREGVTVFPGLAPPVEISHILRETCCLVGHQTVGEGARASAPPLVPARFLPPSMWLLKGQN